MPSPPPLCLIRKTDLDAIPGFMIDDRLVQTVMDVPLVAKPSDVDRVRKDPVEMAPRLQFAAGPSACPARPNRRAKVFGVENGLQPYDAADFEISAKETADERSLVFNDMEGSVFDPVAERNRAAHPDPLPLRGGDLVAD